MNATLEPIRSDHGASFAYFGKREGWLIALSVARDSDALERSNWDVIALAILAEDDADDIKYSWRHRRDGR